MQAVSQRYPVGPETLDPHSRLLRDRIVVLGTEIDDAAANDVIAQLALLEGDDPDREINLYINSPGGSFTAMTAIYDTKRFVGPDVATTCLGQAASAAAVLLGAGAPGTGAVLPHSRVLLHQPSGRAEGPTSDLEVAAREVLRTRDLLEEMVVRHTGQPAATVRSDIERDLILTAPEAVSYGLVDTGDPHP